MPSPEDHEAATPRSPRLDERRAGVLLHLTSLPGRFGCGDLGPEAYRTAELLSGAAQSWWQMLPVGPPGYGNSPYMAASAFALSPNLLSLEGLRDAGLLEPNRLDEAPAAPPGRVDFAALSAFQERLHHEAVRAFRRRNDPGEQAALREFRAREAAWVEDYCLYRALKDESGGAVWTDWEPGVRGRDDRALEAARARLREVIENHLFVQFELDRQWQRFHEHCRSRGLGLIGDIPIFVAHESADVWANPEVFHLDDRGQPTVVAGVPPDYFSATGQRWGHPLYRWDVLKSRKYDWWLRRFRRTFDLFDAVRIDHFIGFWRYWEIPASCPTAVEGRWVYGPADDFFDTLLRETGEAQIIAEDLGLVTPQVTALRRKYEFPGMHVLQFGFSGDPRENPHLPHAYDKGSVVYTGTHDNDTTAGWWADILRRENEGSSAARDERDLYQRYTSGTGSEVHWEMIRLAWASVSKLAVVPAQDLLGLGSEHRMNRPSEAGGNWEWRMDRDALTEPILARLRFLTETFARTGPPPPRGEGEKRPHWEG